MKWNLAVFAVAAVSAILFSACEMELIDFEDADIEQGFLPDLSFNKGDKDGYILKSTDQIREYIIEMKEKHFDRLVYSDNTEESLQKEWDKDIKPMYDLTFNKYTDTFFIMSNLVIIPYSSGDSVRSEERL